MMKHILNNSGNLILTLITIVACSGLLSISFWGVSALHSTKTIDKIEALKLEISAKTADRYHGAEARRDNEAIHKHLDRVKAECAK